MAYKKTLFFLTIAYLTTVKTTFSLIREYRIYKYANIFDFKSLTTGHKSLFSVFVPCTLVQVAYWTAIDLQTSCHVTKSC